MRRQRQRMSCRGKHRLDAELSFALPHKISTASKGSLRIVFTATGRLSVLVSHHSGLQVAGIATDMPLC
jgi:hypothetical protein